MLTFKLASSKRCVHADPPAFPPLLAAELMRRTQLSYADAAEAVGGPLAKASR